GLAFFSVSYSFVMPLSFLLLPASMRRARVQRRHLMRVAIYGLGVPACAILAATALACLGLALGSSRNLVGPFAVVLVAALPLLVLWWAVAIRRYLCIAHSLAVAVLLSFIVLLVPLTVFILASLAAGLMG